MRQVPLMEKPSRALLMSIAITVSIATVISIIAWLEPTCSNQSRRIIMKAAGGVGCFEFWLNRYQSLIGSTLTAAVAGATLVWLAKQLVAADRQVAAADRQAGAAAAAALRGTLGDYRADEEDLHSTGKLLFDWAKNLRSQGQQFAVPPSVEGLTNVADNLIGGMQQALSHIAAVQRRNSSPEIFDASGKIGTCIARVILLTAPNSSSTFEENGETIKPQLLNIHIMQGALIEVEKELDRAHALNNDAMAALFDVLDKTWRQIRAAEAAATGFANLKSS